ncbi:MAG: DUF2283 domain-containing protein [Ignavibacteria bacterium]
MKEFRDGRKETLTIPNHKELDIGTTRAILRQATSESDESKPGIIIDYSVNGDIIGIEILEASKKISVPNKVEYEVA